MAQKRGQWFTPIQVIKLREKVNGTLEKCPMDFVPWEPQVTPLTYFNNSKHYAPHSAYDAFYNQKEGWDQSIHRCDRHHLKPIHENIFEEEKNKQIPVLSSLWYGRTCRPALEDTIKGHGTVNAISNFKAKNGTNMEPGKERTVLPACH